MLQDSTCLSFEDPLSLESLAIFKPQIVLSFGYQHVIPETLLAQVKVPIFNIHISLLPWNRGKDPNLWSWLENTPRGVSIHWISAGLDRGDLVAQKRLEIDSSHTLRSSYNLLTDQALLLLAEVWPQIASGTAPRVPQQPGGSYHRALDKNVHAAALVNGWDTSCAEVLDYGRRQGLW